MPVIVAVTVPVISVIAVVVAVAVAVLPRVLEALRGALVWHDYFSVPQIMDRKEAQG